MKRRWVLLSAYLLTYIAMAALITWVVRYITGPAWLLQQVEITGHADAVKDTKIFHQQNLLFLDTRPIQKELSSSGLIRSVTVRKIYPDKLQIILEERYPVIRLSTSDQDILLDAEAMILPVLPRFSTVQLPEIECNLLTIINNEGQRVSELLPLISVISEIDRQPQISVNGGKCLNSLHYSLITEDLEILIDISKNATDTVASLLFLVKQFRIEGKWPKVIDLRFDKPVLLPVNNTTNNSTTNTAEFQ